MNSAARENSSLREAEKDPFRLPVSQWKKQEEEEVLLV